MTEEQFTTMMSLVEAQVKATSLRSTRNRFMYRNGFCAGFRSALSCYVDKTEQLRRTFNLPKEWYK